MRAPQAESQAGAGAWGWAAPRAGRDTPGTCGRAGPGGLRAGLRPLKSPPPVGSLAPWAPAAPLPHPCHGKLQTIWNGWRPETGRPTQTNFHPGSPTPDKAPELRAAQGARERDLRRRHPTPASVLQTTGTEPGARSRGDLADIQPAAAERPSAGPSHLQGGGVPGRWGAGWESDGEGGAPALLAVLHTPLELGPFGANEPTRHRPGQWRARLEWPGPPQPWKNPPPAFLPCAPAAKNIFIVMPIYLQPGI